MIPFSIHDRWHLLLRFYSLFLIKSCLISLTHSSDKIFCILSIQNVGKYKNLNIKELSTCCLSIFFFPPVTLSSLCFFSVDYSFYDWQFSEGQWFPFRCNWWFLQNIRFISAKSFLRNDLKHVQKPYKSCSKFEWNHWTISRHTYDIHIWSRICHGSHFQYQNKRFGTLFFLWLHGFPTKQKKSEIISADKLLVRFLQWDSGDLFCVYWCFYI